MACFHRWASRPPTLPIFPNKTFIVDVWGGSWFAQIQWPSRAAEETQAMNEQILQEISEFCRSRGLAESTFGRRAVNDGKLASRLRNGGRITTETLERIRSFMAKNTAGVPMRRRVLFEDRPQQVAPLVAPPVAPAAGVRDPQRNFRFFDNRQKYLLFVNTCSEKWEIANRVSLELANIHPRPPAVRLFDAGVGDGTV